MRSLLILVLGFALGSCVAFSDNARAQDSPPALPSDQKPAITIPDPPQAYPPAPIVQPGNQAKFDQGLAAYDAKDYDTAFKIFSELADDYDLAAMRNVALMERDGLGTDKDPKAAQDEMEQAALRGLPTAQADYGVMLLDGYVDPPNPKAAIPWLEKAAGANHPVAEYRLGLMYEIGEAVPQDLKYAEQLYEGAASRMPEAAARLAALKAGQPLPPPPTVQD
ncbi:MAG TPA: tetratricopeptide repeat protein [Rhizomicrobium sp.]|jgi:hypothetical protein|nr:tetratricopeptide repeat protein [Rhizomicrobium sp.]